MTKLDRLKKCNEHLNIALAELGKIAGGTYVGGLRDLRKLISVKLKLENIIKETERGERLESRRIKCKGE